MTARCWECNAIIKNGIACEECKASASQPKASSNDWLCWRSKPPTEPGWYWVKCYQGLHRVIVEVFIRPGHKYLCIADPEGCEHFKRNFLAVSRMNTEWSGRIPESVVY